MRPLALAVLCALLSPAWAGTVSIRDEVGLLSPGDRMALEATGPRWQGFDVRVLVSSSAPNKQAFDVLVGSGVTGPLVLSLGLDPRHRFTSVHFGTGLNIPRGSWQAISDAGNPHFKGARWSAGIEAIADQAAQNIQAAVSPPVTAVPLTGVVSQPAPQPKPQEGSGLGWILLFLLMGVAGIGAVAWFTGRSEREQRRKNQTLASVFAGPGASPPPPVAQAVPQYVPPPPPPRVVVPPPVVVRPAPVVVQQPPIVMQQPAVVHHHHDSGGGDLLTGVLIGQAMGNGHHHHDRSEPVPRVIERERIIERPRRETPVRSDAGGVSSSWSVREETPAPAASSSSSSSWDSGSSSSYDSGSSSSWDSGSSSSGSDSGGSSGSDW